jgi:uncharacterized protein YjeT (DUF2065 family)
MRGCATFGFVDAIDLLLPALGLALFLEGLPWFVSPGGVRRTMTRIATLDDAPLRVLGLAMMSAGLLIAWWAVG